MENASKALIMAGGILLGILIITLMVTLMLSSREMTSTYDNIKKEEAVEQFNSNFIKYINKDLTIHEVVTICNFAENNKTHKVKINKGKQTSNNIEKNIEKKYKLKIENYSNEGYVNSISINE